MKNILVPTDFSIASRNAAKYAVSLAQSFDAKVTLVNVATPPIIINDSILASVIITQAEILEANRKLMEQEIETLSKQYTRISGFIEEGFTLDIIPKWVVEKQADLVVMGMKGKGKSSSVFGSTTTALIQRCSFPIFVIPEMAIFNPIHSMTFASDFDAAIESDRYTPLLEISQKFDAVINILHVQKKESDLKSEEAIGKMKTSLVFSKHKHQFHTITENKVEEGINKFIEQNQTDALAMVAHKHSLFERMFGKVHTKAMSYQTEIPLLVLQNK
ncbi:MAG TPA: universal stress protein [Hanamia sp.]|nr:universal stress protein [Hanamia sp.]